jgi:D-glycerate 3-kinase
MPDAFDQSLATGGPAFAQVQALGPIDWERWGAAAATLEQRLAGAADLDRRIHQLYLPVLFFCLAQLERARTRPVLVGIQAPQGSGKTTLTTHLLALLPAMGLRGTAISIDDFYLTRGEQLQLAARNPGNPYLEHRGYPGTHDVGLGESTLVDLRNVNRADAPVQVPVYDKSAHVGRGDRAPVSDWRRVAGPVDLVLLEGWMLGFTPVAESELPDRMMVEPNRALADYDRWYRQLDAFVALRAADPLYVMKWRVEAEAAMAAQGRPALSRADIEDYVQRFIPAYRTWGGTPGRFARKQKMELTLDELRRATTS